MSAAPLLSQAAPPAGYLAFESQRLIARLWAAATLNPGVLSPFEESLVFEAFDRVCGLAHGARFTPEEWRVLIDAEEALARAVKELDT